MKLQILAAACLLTLAALPAQAVGRLADVSLIDRHSGQTLATHYYRGEYWVAGVPGAKYSVAVRNRLGARILAVTAVDGVNVLTGETAGWEQSGYVFGGSQRYQITGWRKSDSEVAAFEFSDASNSYAQRTGRPAHVGVIGVALFREKPLAPPPMIERSLRQAPSAPFQGRGEAGPAEKSQLAESERDSGAASSAMQEAARGRLADRLSPKLGTAHGQREQSYVSATSFERQNSQPDELIRIRYDSHENLVAMGVIRPTLPHPGQLNPFPGSPVIGFVPDPPVLR